MPIIVSEPDSGTVDDPGGLLEYQIDLDGMVFGGTEGPYADRLLVHDIVESTAEWLTEDAANPGGDGARPGRDRLPGGSLQIVLTARGSDAAGALDVMRQLRAVWQDRRWREPGVVVPLRFRLPGRETVRVYGRPRRWAGSLTDVVFGRVPITAEFEMLDPLFYGDVEQVLSIRAVAAGTAGGVEWPWLWPITFTGLPTARDVAVNGGDVATYPTVTFRGPISGQAVNPSLRKVGKPGRLWLARTLAPGDAVIVETRLDGRGAWLPGGGNVAGDLRGDYLDEFVLPAGGTYFDFEVDDPSGTSLVEVRWRDAWTSL